MIALPLDNPIWSSLAFDQAPFAVGGASAKRYPAEVAPFCAVPTADATAESELAEIITVGEELYLCGVAPQLSAAWKMEERAPVLQMIYASDRKLAADAVQIRLLSEADLPAMLALTTLVFPEYFRPRAPQLGTYLGIEQAGGLAAMAGERMYLSGHRELSAVCTHPDFLGRGFAQALISRLVNDMLERNEIPFLHVGRNNERAKSIYERLGFTTRCSLPLWSIQRQV
jgi:ribosomal protein S18 acetylase RimI-like enzyme